MNCPLCDSADHTVFHSLAEEHILSRCRQCGFVFSITAPSEQKVRALYQEGYFRSWGLDDPSFHSALRDLKTQTFRKHLKRLMSFTTPGEVLDVGCAMGFFMEVAVEEGWSAWGVEVSEEAARIAQRRFGDRVFHGVLSEAKFPDGRFDLVVMFDVIEHIVDPNEILREASRVLKSGGLLMITTPDIGSLSAKAMGKTWTHFKASEHLCFFNRRTIKSFLAHWGFSVLIVTAAVKVFNLRYLAFQFQRYPTPFFSWFSSILFRALPKAALDRTFPLVAGDLLVIARKVDKQ